MDLALLIYLIDRSEVIFNGPLVFISVLTLIVLACLRIAYSSAGGKDSADSFVNKRGMNMSTRDSEEFANFYYNLPRKAILWCTLPFVIGYMTLPSKDTAYTMLAAYGVQSVAESDEAQRMAGKSLEVLEKAMDDYLEKN